MWEEHDHYLRLVELLDEHISPWENLSISRDTPIPMPADAEEAKRQEIGELRTRRGLSIERLKSIEEDLGLPLSAHSISQLCHLNRLAVERALEESIAKLVSSGAGKRRIAAEREFYAARIAAADRLSERVQITDQNTSFSRRGRIDRSSNR